MNVSWLLGRPSARLSAFGFAYLSGRLTTPTPGLRPGSAGEACASSCLTQRKCAYVPAA